jgi:hypothetical protein
MRTLVPAFLVALAATVLASIGCGTSDPDPTPTPTATPTATPTPCTPTLDQSGAGGSFGRTFGSPGGYRDVAQTVTIGLAGTLERVAVFNVLLLGGLEPLVLEVRDLVGDFPDETPGALLGTTSVPNASLSPTYATVSFDLSALGIAVTPGQMLAFVLRSNGNEMGIQTSGGDNYAGGQAVQFTPTPTPTWETILDYDFGFEVHVCVP